VAAALPWSWVVGEAGGDGAGWCGEEMLRS
jgi:hypothetical protein